MFCPHCGMPNDDNNFRCTRCANVIQPLPPPPPSAATDRELLHWLLPVGRSWWAIAAGYAGLFAVLIVPAPLALGLGLMALRDLRLHPELGGGGRAWLGVIAGGLGTLVLLSMLGPALVARLR